MSFVSRMKTALMANMDTLPRTQCSVDNNQVSPSQFSQNVDRDRNVFMPGQRNLLDKPCMYNTRYKRGFEPKGCKFGNKCPRNHDIDHECTNKECKGFFKFTGNNGEEYFRKCHTHYKLINEEIAHRYLDARSPPITPHPQTIKPNVDSSTLASPGINKEETKQSTLQVEELVPVTIQEPQSDFSVIASEPIQNVNKGVMIGHMAIDESNEDEIMLTNPKAKKFGTYVMALFMTKMKETGMTRNQAVTAVGIECGKVLYQMLAVDARKAYMFVKGLKQGIECCPDD